MCRIRVWHAMALATALVAANGGCVLIPEIKDRIVELAVGGTTSATFTVQGSATTVDETVQVDVGTELNLAQILADAGIDVSNVTNIALTSVAYRIVRADPDPAREVTSGGITVQRGAGTVDQLVAPFSASPGVVSGFQNLALQPAGAATLNQLLDDILNALPGAPANPTVTFHLTADTFSAGGQPTDFDLEVKVTITITGTVKVSVPT